VLYRSEFTNFPEFTIYNSIMVTLRTKLQPRLHHFETAEPMLQLAETSSSEACPLDSPEQLAGGGQQQFVLDFGDHARAMTEFHNKPNVTATVRMQQPMPDKLTTVSIWGREAFVTKRFFVAKDMAEGFGIDTSAIVQFDKNALIEKMVFGPSDVLGKWDLCAVMMAFAPTMYSERRNAVRALAQTSIADYPSRMEVQMAHNNVSLLNFLYQQY
jgi:hypothetical protein